MRERAVPSTVLTRVEEKKRTVLTIVLKKSLLKEVSGLFSARGFIPREHPFQELEDLYLILKPCRFDAICGCNFCSVTATYW